MGADKAGEDQRAGVLLLNGVLCGYSKSNRRNLSVLDEDVGRFDAQGVKVQDRRTP
jgi:hypothetical protein